MAMALAALAIPAAAAKTWRRDIKYQRVSAVDMIVGRVERDRVYVSAYIDRTTARAC